MSALIFYVAIVRRVHFGLTRDSRSNSLNRQISGSLVLLLGVKGLPPSDRKQQQRKIHIAAPMSLVEKKGKHTATKSLPGIEDPAILEAVLMNSSSAARFQELGRKHFIHESTLFLQAVYRFRQVPKEDSERIFSAYEDIIRTFILDDAHLEINVGCHARLRPTRFFGDRDSFMNSLNDVGGETASQVSNIFNEVFDEVHKMLSDNVHLSPTLCDSIAHLTESVMNNPEESA
mmetsp:Transcript_19214/g.33693  ORF Transcript_19214/g.33693 Transcript_19214/m.33693 type:complete len:232 (-) Transcript_19214:125-820(-)